MKPITRVGLPALLSLAACAGSAQLPAVEIAAVERSLADYRQAWLDGDAERVLSHVSDSVTLFVPGAGASTIVGKEAVRAFWFPATGTRYPIRRYEISQQRTFGGGGYAVSQGWSDLAWDTVIGDSVVSSSTSRSEFITVLRKEEGAWRIYRQMYVTRN